MGGSKSPQIWSWSTNLQMPRKPKPAGVSEGAAPIAIHLSTIITAATSWRGVLWDDVYFARAQHTHTHRVNVRTCIIDVRLPLQQAPTVIKKRPFCFISPLHHAYRLICIISSIWCRPRKRLPLWFPLLGILPHFVVSLSAAPHAGAPHRRRILNWSRSGASAESCNTIRAFLPIVSALLSFDVDSLVAWTLRSTFCRRS